MVHPTKLEILQICGRKLDRFYRSLYLPNFPIVNEREDAETSKELPWGDDNTCKLHVLLAGIGLRGPAPRIVGAHVFEYYPQSRCGLLTYFAVRRNARKQGVGRRLFTLAVAILKKTARRNDKRLRAIFAEVNDPEQVRPREDVMPARERSKILRAPRRRQPRSSLRATRIRAGPRAWPTALAATDAPERPGSYIDSGLSRPRVRDRTLSGRRDFRRRRQPSAHAARVEKWENRYSRTTSLKRSPDRKVPPKVLRLNRDSNSWPPLTVRRIKHAPQED